MPRRVLAVLLGFGLLGLYFNSSRRLQDFHESKRDGVSVIRPHAAELLLFYERWKESSEALQKITGYTDRGQFFDRLLEDYQAGDHDQWLVPEDRTDFALICLAFDQVESAEELVHSPEDLAVLRTLAEKGLVEGEQRSRLEQWGAKHKDDWWSEIIRTTLERKPFVLADSELADAANRQFHWRLTAAALSWLLRLLGIPAFLWTIWVLVRAKTPPVRRLQASWLPNTVLGLWLWTEIFTFVLGLAVGVIIGAGASVFSGGTHDRPYDHPAVEIGWTLVSAALAMAPALLLLHILTPGVLSGCRMLGLKRPGLSNWSLVTIGIGGMIMASAVQQPLHSVEYLFGSNDPTDSWSREYSDLGPMGIVLELALGCLVAPLAEEIVFRGFLFSAFRNRWGDFAGALISSALFAVVHYYSVLGSLSIFMVGMVFCLIYDRTRTLWTSILAHAFYNLVATLG